MPLLASLIVAVRGFVGIQTFGVFAPMLLTLALGQTGLGIGVPLFAVILGAGLLTRWLTKPLHLPRIGRLALLMSVVVAVILAVNTTIGTFAPLVPLVAALPIVVLAMIIERFWARWEQEQLLDAVQTAGWTLLVAVAAYPLLIMGPARSLAE